MDSPSCDEDLRANEVEREIYHEHWNCEECMSKLKNYDIAIHVDIDFDLSNINRFTSRLCDYNLHFCGF